MSWSEAAAAEELPNGGAVDGAILVAGAKDTYTFSGNAGENVQLRVVDLADGTLYPRLSLYDPFGGFITSGSGASVGSIARALPSTGTYSVVVEDVSVGAAATGPYRLYFTRAPGANEGGALVNGGFVSGTIDKGDLDSFTFFINAAEAFQLRVVDLGTSAFYPRITLYDPTGSHVTFGNGSNVGSIERAAAMTGVYTVVVSDAQTGEAEVGDYNLYFTRAPGANEGGALPNGGVVSGWIDKGDLDSFTFSINAGEGFQLRIADLGTSAFYPRITLYDPTGSQVTFGNGSTVGSIERTATMTGVYTVVVSDAQTGEAQVGDYDLYFTRAPGANEGGALYDGATRANVIDLGDLDSYTFSATAGQQATLTLTDTSGGGLYPRITLYDPSGTHITFANGANGATLIRSLTKTGTYTVVVADASTGESATGSYTLSLTGAGGSAQAAASVPVPAWSILLLSFMLVGAASIANRRRLPSAVQVRRR